MKKVYKTSCDMASIKIFNDSMAVFFGNEMGDFVNTVEVYDKKTKTVDKEGWEFLEHFTVKTVAYLSSYDCDDLDCHEFGPGRYFVYLGNNCHFKIVREDDALWA